MAQYKVQQEPWRHWPKVLVVEQWSEYGLAFGRYVPDKGTCHVSVGEGIRSGWWVCSECGDMFDSLRTIRRDLLPNYCPNCGKKVET